MHTIDRLHHFLVRQPLLWSFTVMTRIALALGFLPSGMTKVLRRPFTRLDPENWRIGYFFDGFFQAGSYYVFVGVCQVAAALLLLVPRTSFFGSTAAQLPDAVSYSAMALGLVCGLLAVAAWWRRLAAGKGTAERS